MSVCGCDEQEIVRRFSEGEKRTAIARVCGCPREYVERLLAYGGHWTPDVAPSLRRQIASRYRKGVPIYLMAVEYGLAETVVSAVIAAAGLAIKSAGRPPYRTGELKSVVALYHSGGVAAIQRKYGISATTAYRRLRRARG